MYTLDTNILIYYTKDDPVVAEFFDTHLYTVGYIRILTPRLQAGAPGYNSK